MTYNIKTSLYICSANQWTRLYMIGASAMKEFKQKLQYFPVFCILETIPGKYWYSTSVNFSQNIEFLLGQHCVKGTHFWSVFSCIETENGDLLCKFPWSVWMQETGTRNSPNTGTTQLNCYFLFGVWIFFSGMNSSNVSIGLNLFLYSF